VPAGALLPSLGVLDARTVVYRTSFSLTPEQAASTETLRCSILAGDGVAVDVNGHIVTTADSGTAVVSPWIKAGENSIRALYVQGGQANFGPEIEDLAGLRSATLRSKAPNPTEVLKLMDWKIARSWTGAASGWAQLSAGDKAGWTRVALESGREVPRKSKLDGAPSGPTEGLAVWYRLEFKLPVSPAADWVPWRVLLDAAGDGPVYLNGEPLGRYWEQGPQREYYLPECWLKFGDGQTNVITLCLSPMKKGVAVRAVEVAPYADQAEVRGQVQHEGKPM
jgi:hypothetical protein